MEGQALTARTREPFSPAFLAGDARAGLFLAPDFRSRAERAACVRRAAQRGVGPQIASVIREQDRARPWSEARGRNLEALSTPGTAAVVTGQQVGLFLGPLYTFYKAASAVAIARALESETGIRCVPIFWLQTEDHDFPEVSHCYVPVAGHGPRKLALEADPQGADAARASLGHRLLGEDICPALDGLEDAVRGTPDADRVMALWRSAYRPGERLAGAFAGVLSALFAEEGLLIIDPRDPAVSRLARPVYAAALTDSERLGLALQERSRTLEDAGFAVQVPVRASTSLSFFHLGSDRGPRFRLELKGDSWTASGADRAWSTHELLEVLQADPLRFSSSALLRPILQDALLPTAGYVAGPGELNYFAQMAPLYAAFELPPPLIVPRARFRCVDERTRGRLAKLGLQAADLELASTQLLAKLPREESAGGPSAETLRGQLLDGLFRQLDALEARHPEPALAKAIRRTRESVRRNVERLVRRYDRALRDKDSQSAEQLELLRAALCPDGIPQERCYCLPPLLARHGIEVFKSRVMAAIDPFSGAVKDLSL